MRDPQHWTRYSLPLKPRVWLISESQMHCSCLPRSDRDRAWATAWSAAVREGGQLSRWGSCAVADPECQSAISEIIVGCADQKRNRMTGCRGSAHGFSFRGAPGCLSLRGGAPGRWDAERCRARGVPSGSSGASEKARQPRARD